MKTISFLFAILWMAVSSAHADPTVYSVQVTTSTNYEQALSYYTSLKDHKNVRIEMIKNAYVVRLGAYRERSEALPLLKQLQGLHPDAIIMNCYIIEDRIKASSKMDRIHPEQSKAPAPSAASSKPGGEAIKTPTSTAVAAKEAKGSAPGPVKGADVTEPHQPPVQNPEDYFKKGIQQYQDRQYEKAIGFLSQYLSLVPKSRQRVSAMMILGKSFDQLNHSRAALGLFSRLIDEYPDSPEAALSMIAMADIGLDRTGIKYPIGIKGAEFVMDPVLGYDEALGRNIPRTTVEYACYQKGRALWKKGQYMEAYRLMSDLLKEFPRTLYRGEIVRSLKSGALTLISQYQQSGDHLAAANIFLQAKKGGAITQEDTAILLKASLSLAYLGLYEEAVKLVSPLKKITPAQAQQEIDHTLAEIERIRPSDVPNRSKDFEKWELFESGRSYMTSNNLPLAEQTLTELKSSGGDPFWSKVTEYALDEGKWHEKYPTPGDPKRKPLR